MNRRIYHIVLNMGCLSSRLGWWVLVGLWLLLPDISAQSIHSAGVNLQLRQYGFDAGLWANLKPKNQEIQSGFFIKKGAYLGLLVGLLKDPSEALVINDRLPGSKPFKLNKVSHTWMIQPQIGKVGYVSERKSRNELGLRVKWGVSLPMAYNWPLYVRLYRSGFLADEYIDVEYNPSIHPANQIGGLSSSSKGIKDGQWIPGLGGQLAMEFEWGNYGFLTNSLSVGISTTAFIKKIPNWYDVAMNKMFFPSVFATFAVGFNAQKHP